MKSQFVSVAAALAVVLLAGCTCSVPTSCTQREDCLDPQRPFCAPALGACVECLDDDGCPEGSLCNPQGLCEAGCRDAHGTCALGRFCVEGAGCVQCVSDDTCGPGNVCANHACVPGCSADSPDCPQGTVCDVAAGRCVGCLDAGDCDAPPLDLCDAASRTCVECLGDGDCTDATRPTCDPVSHACVGCVDGADCPAGQRCSNATCVPGCDALNPCPQGEVCTPAGQCVQCTADAQCAGATPRCDVASNTCVACLPSADNCPPGQYCRADFVCETGCKTGSDCASGVCLPNHSCQGCVGDGECAAGHVCQGGVCVEACGPQTACGAGLDCCQGHCRNLRGDVAHCGGCNVACTQGQACCQSGCADLQADANNCGACGNVCAPGAACCAGQCKPLNTLGDCGACGVACGVDQFCDGASCRDQTFPEFCANLDVYAIRDGIALDDAATATLVSTVQQHCSAQTRIFNGPQTNPAWVDQTTGALLLGGGTTVVTAGGPFPNLVVKGLERQSQSTKVYFATNGLDTWHFKRRSDDAVLVSRLQTWCAPEHDVFLVELVADPASGTLALMTYGLCSPGNGTQAGAWYWANVMLPNRASYTDSWYIYEWSDTNADGQPDPGDTFSKLASGT